MNQAAKSSQSSTGQRPSLFPKLGPDAPAHKGALYTCRARLPPHLVPAGSWWRAGRGEKGYSPGLHICPAVCTAQRGGSLKKGPLRLKQSTGPFWNFKRQFYPDRNLSNKTEKLGSNY